MAAWRLHLSDQTVRRLDMLTGKPSVLAAWSGPGRVSFFDLASGAPLGGRRVGLDAPDGEPAALDLAAPNGAVLPVARLTDRTLFTSADGRMTLTHHYGGDLVFDADGEQTVLPREAGADIVAVAFDRSLGTTAALDRDARLHLYARRVRVGTADLGLTSEAEWAPGLAVAYGGTPLFCTDGRTLVVTDDNGRERTRLALHYQAGLLACSSDGRYVAVVETGTEVVRVYQAPELVPTHQRFAADLLAEARRAQLLPGDGGLTAVSALAINAKGALAFAMSGTVCVTNITRMGQLPRG